MTDRPGTITWKIMSIFRWLTQRPPGNMPLVVRRGVLLSDGIRHEITGWTFDFRSSPNEITGDELWRYLAAKYPVTPTDFSPSPAAGRPSMTGTQLGEPPSES